MDAISEMKQIPSLPGYFITADGRVYFKNEMTGSMEEKMPREKFGYTMVRIQRGSRRIEYRVHRLILEAWEGPCPEGLNALHKDDNRKHNTLDNLYWGTKRDNAADRVANAKEGKTRRWTSEEMQVEIFNSYPGMSLRQLAEKYNLTISGVSKLLKRARERVEGDGY